MALKRLNTEHYIAIKLLALPNRGGKTMDEVAKECGVARSTLYEWKKDPLFDRELNKEIVREGKSRLPEVIANMYTVAAETENAAMAKLVLQLNGMLTDKVEVTANKADGIDYDALDDELASFGKTLASDED
jgi:transposase-like protein